MLIQGHESSTVPFAAVVLAADRTPRDPVAQAAGACCKALSPVGGTPMVWRVLEALGASQYVDTRILCGPPWSAVEQNADLHSGIASGKLKWIESQNTPSSSAHIVLQSLPETVPVLLTTADHALLSAPMVDYFCAQAQASGCDVVFAVATHERIAVAYPGLRRTVTKLRDGGYCGCNLFAFMTPRGRAMADFWRRVEHQRKQPLWVIAGAVGWLAVFRYLLGRLTLDEGLARLSRRLELRVGAVIMPFAEAAVDVDSAADWVFAETLVRGG